MGETHELLIEVRDALVRISFDGAVQIEHAGPLPSERQHDFAFYPPGRGREPFIGIGVCGGDLTIHSAEFREVDKDGKPGGR